MLTQLVQVRVTWRSSMSSRMAGRSASLAREVCYNGGFLREPLAKSADQGGSRQ